MQKKIKNTRPLKKRQNKAAQKATTTQVKALSKQELAALWIDLNEGISPPVQTKAQVLPLEKLSWENFERLCYRLAVRSGDAIDARIYGVPGQLQMGIDVLVRVADAGKYVAWQCKRYKKFTPADLKAAVDEFLRHDWVKSSKIFHVAVSADLSDTKLTDAVEKQAKRCSKLGVDLVPLDKGRISEMLKKHADLVDDFFDRPWVVAFCGQEAADSLGARKLSKEKKFAARKRLSEIYTTHFNVVDLGLPAAASPLQESTPALSLQQRYVTPKVDAITTQIVTRAVAATNVADSETQAVAPSGNGPRETEHSGFRVSTYRDKRGLFDWLAPIHRGLILGGPGTGKSATLRFLTLDLLSDRPSNEILARKWGGLLPIFIPFAMLTRLVAKGEALSISDFLKKWLAQLGAPDEVIALLTEALDDERLLLIVDGLDEWTDQDAANTALVMILDFITPRRLPTLASARPLGYERLGTVGSEWKKAELRPFDLPEQRAFINLWFTHFHKATLSPTVSPTSLRSAANQQTEALLSEIDSDEDLLELAGIPLLLSALVYLRLLGRVLPNNKFDALAEITKSLIHEQPQRRAAAALQVGKNAPQNQGILERGLEFLALLIHGRLGSESIGKEEAKAALSNFYRGAEFLKSPESSIEIATQLLETSPKDVGIIVERQPGEIGFLYRSLQEFLAAKELSHRPFDSAKEFILAKCAEPGWQDVVLGTLHLLQRQNEVDDVLTAIQKLQLGSFEQPLQQILLARAIFGSVRCSPQFAGKASEAIIHLIEQSSWMPLRKALLVEVVRGLSSELVGQRVREKIDRWFPGREQWRMNLFAALAANPTENTGQLLFTALFNSDNETEMKEIAEAIARSSASWTTLGADLCRLLFRPAETDLLSCALHALCLGWPNHPQLKSVLTKASASKAGKLRCLALIHRSERGDTSVEVRKGLKEFCRRGEHVYPWEELLISTLGEKWAGDTDFRALALESVRHWRMPTEWNEHIGFGYLVRAFPMDDEVAEIIATKLAENDRGLGYLDHDRQWDLIFKNFKAHPKIIPTAENWLEKNGLSSHSDPDIGQIALLAGSEKCKQVLFDRLAGGKLSPQWTVSVLIDLCGSNDQKLRAAFQTFILDKKRLGSVANFLPHFIDDQDECKRTLIELLKIEDSFDFVHALNGLEEMGLAQSAEIVGVVEGRLRDDQNRRVWRIGKGALIKLYPENPLVKKAAIDDIESADPALYVLARVYARDGVIRPLLDRMTERLHDDLRLVLIQTLGNFSFGEHAFTRRILSMYESEWHPEVRTAAAHAYYSHIQKVEPDPRPFIAKLTGEMKAVGEGFEENRQAAAAGLLALNEPRAILDPVLNFHGSAMPLTTHARSDQNWPFIRILIASWEKMTAALGEQVWSIVREWDLVVWHLSQTDGGSALITVPPKLIDEAKRQAHADVDAFRTLSVLQAKSPEFRDFCLGLFEKMRRREGQMSVSWGYNEVKVWFEAAEYLAQNYVGDPVVRAKLEDIAKNSNDPSGPIIALCRGWPSSAEISKIWNLRPGTPTSPEPAAAWLVSVKGELAEFFEYLKFLPNRIPGESWWRFPRETVRAVRHRLIGDKAAQSGLLEHFATETNVDVLATIARLSGAVVQDRKALRSWATKHIQTVRREDDFQPMGFDLFSGVPRPVEFCLLEAGLTSQ
jgi:hypothetical protein